MERLTCSDSLQCFICIQDLLWEVWRHIWQRLEHVALCIVDIYQQIQHKELLGGLLGVHQSLQAHLNSDHVLLAVYDKGLS